LKFDFYNKNSFLYFIFPLDPHSVNNTDSFSRDCLTYAIQQDNYDILKFLISNGANVNNIASGNLFIFPFFQDSDENYSLIFIYIKDSSTSLHRAVYKNSSDMVQLLLENKANINAQDSFNRAPLHWSVVNPDVDCLKVNIFR
jgi:ankyrin repeat protein